MRGHAGPRTRAVGRPEEHAQKGRAERPALPPACGWAHLDSKRKFFEENKAIRRTDANRRLPAFRRFPAFSKVRCKRGHMSPISELPCSTSRRSCAPSTLSASSSRCAGMGAAPRSPARSLATCADAGDDVSHHERATTKKSPPAGALSSVPSRHPRRARTRDHRDGSTRRPKKSVSGSVRQSASRRSQRRSAARGAAAPSSRPA